MIVFSCFDEHGGIFWDTAFCSSSDGLAFLIKNQNKYRKSSLFRPWHKVIKDFYNTEYNQNKSLPVRKFGIQWSMLRYYLAQEHEIMRQRGPFKNVSFGARG